MLISMWVVYNRSYSWYLVGLAGWSWCYVCLALPIFSSAANNPAAIWSVDYDVTHEISSRIA